MGKLRLELGIKGVPQVKEPAVAGPSNVISAVIESMALGASDTEHKAEREDKAVFETSGGYDQIVQHVDAALDTVQRLYDLGLSAPASPLAAVVLQNIEDLQHSLNAVRGVIGAEPVTLREIDLDPDLHSDQYSPADTVDDSPITLRVDTRFFQTPESAVVRDGHSIVFPVFVTLSVARQLFYAIKQNDALPAFPEIALFAQGFDAAALDYFASSEVATKCRIVPAAVECPRIENFRRFVSEELGQDYPFSCSDAGTHQDSEKVLVDMQLYIQQQRYLKFTSADDGVSVSLEAVS